MSLATPSDGPTNSDRHGYSSAKGPAVLRQLGMQRVVKTWLTQACLRPRYLRQLERLLGHPLGGPSPRLLRMGAEKLPLPDNSVDAIISNNVFEHIADVPAVVKEIRRVLK